LTSALRIATSLRFMCSEVMESSPSGPTKGK
jgi:hypothetical protein